MSDNNPSVSFNIPATDTQLIDSIIELIRNGTTQGSSTDTEEAPAKTARKTSSTTKSAPAKKEVEVDYMDYEEFKEAAKKAKAEHGEEFVIAVMEDSGVKKKASLGTTVKSVPEKSRSLIAKLWAMGEEELAEDEEADLDEDDFDEEDDAEVTAESVQLALKAYAKENDKAAAKEIMAKYKVKVLADVEKLDDKKLAALMKELV